MLEEHGVWKLGVNASLPPEPPSPPGGDVGSGRELACTNFLPSVATEGGS